MSQLPERLTGGGAPRARGGGGTRCRVPRRSLAACHVPGVLVCVLCEWNVPTLSLELNLDTGHLWPLDLEGDWQWDWWGVPLTGACVGRAHDLAGPEMAHSSYTFFSGLCVRDCTLPHPHASCYSCFFFLPEPLAKKV